MTCWRTCSINTIKYKVRYKPIVEYLCQRYIGVHEKTYMRSFLYFMSQAPYVRILATPLAGDAVAVGAPTVVVLCAFWGCSMGCTSC
jgi:hypothetical protein